ncbi:hypothetical protein F5Y09DRAFT_185973 [Xylaria sp. FL1042]|nr:hypothetical protein F5Y09DRAFT_185973 [Xylaria sp. FL1042]
MQMLPYTTAFFLFLFIVRVLPRLNQKPLYHPYPNRRGETQAPSRRISVSHTSSRACICRSLHLLSPSALACCVAAGGRPRGRAHHCGSRSILRSASPNVYDYLHEREREREREYMLYSSCVVVIRLGWVRRFENRSGERNPEWKSGI